MASWDANKCVYSPDGPTLFIFMILHFYVFFFFFGQIHRFFGQVPQLMFVGVIFRSLSIVHIRRCEFHLVIFLPNLGHIESVKITSLIIIHIIIIRYG